jgi:photosystem II stability/assembly factor-like uncharacterized protein
MKSMVRLIAIIGLAATAVSVAACSEIKPATSAEVDAIGAAKTGPL